MLSEMVERACLVSVACGAAGMLATQGSAKKVIRLLSSIVLAVMLLSQFKDFDITAYAVEAARYRERSLELTQKYQDASSRLNRLVIQDEYETYIYGVAEDMDVKLTKCEIEVKWSTDGVWYPAAATLSADIGDTEKKSLAGIITAELGIGEESVIWV